VWLYGVGLVGILLAAVALLLSWSSVALVSGVLAAVAIGGASLRTLLMAPGRAERGK
jgi:hypothetical protein